MTLKEWMDQAPDRKQEDVARDLGLDQGYLSRLVRGESVGSPATIQKIATLTDGAVTFDDMVKANAAYVEPA